jgi:type III secretion protein T
MGRTVTDAGALYEWYQQMLLIAPRGLIAALMVPLFAPRLVPQGARAAVSLAMVTVAMLGASGQAIHQLPSGAGLAVLFLKEVGIGLCLGLAFGLVFWVGRTIGELIDHQTALTFSQNIDQTHGNQVSVTGGFLEQLLIGYFIAAGGLLVFADALLLSYELWPVQQPLPALSKVVMPLAVLESARLFSLALLLAGPVLLVLFMLDIGFGLLGRAAPQINLFDLSIPIKGLVALFVLLLALPFLVQQMAAALLQVRKAVVTVMGG